MRPDRADEETGQGRDGTFVTFDIDAAAAHFMAHGMPVRIKPLSARPGRIEFRSIGHAVEGVTFARIRFDEPAAITPLEGFDAYELMFAAAGTTSIDLGSRTVTCDQAHAAIFDVMQAQAVRRSAHSENYAILIDQRLLTRRLSELTGTALTRRLEFSPDSDLSQRPLAALRAIMTGVDSGTLLPMLAEAPLSAARLSALLTDLVLELLPHNYRDRLHRKPGLIAPRHVKRTIDYIEAHADAELPAEDLARVSGVSLRALQYGFRKFLGLSISEFERSVRLNRVRRDIEARPGDPVGTIARKWGFSNYTRFNIQFEAAFGVSASSLRGPRGQGGAGFGMIDS